MASIRETRPGVHHVRLRRGKLAPEYLTVTGTRAEAEDFLQRYTATQTLRALPRTAPLGTWLRHCIAQRADLAAQTVASYRKYVDLWIDPPAVPGWSLGRIRVCDLASTDLETFKVHSLESRELRGKRALGADARRKIILLVRWAMNQAVTVKMVQANPFILTRLPKAEKLPAQLPTDQELQRLEAITDPRTRLLLILARDTGARRGELLALRWRDIDLRDARMTIGASLDHLRGTAPALKEPKTRAGRRAIKLPLTAMAALRAALAEANRTHRTLQLVDYPVFYGDAGGGESWWHPEAASQAALRALETIGLRRASRPVSLHTLRHAHATALLREGVSPHVVCRRLGHADVRVTLGLYAHALPADDAAAAASFDQLLARPAQDIA